MFGNRLFLLICSCLIFYFSEDGTVVTEIRVYLKEKVNFVTR